MFSNIFFFWRGVCLSLSGCKFSVEEERVVIELQAQFGNKWARIATYLPGRTDNDVKNFWSSRQKRLARILQTSGTANKPQKNKRAVQTCHDVSASQVNVFDNLFSLFKLRLILILGCLNQNHMCSLGFLKVNIL